MKKTILTVLVFLALSLSACSGASLTTSPAAESAVSARTDAAASPVATPAQNASDAVGLDTTYRVSLS
jgi:hypothetical protein